MMMTLYKLLLCDDENRSDGNLYRFFTFEKIKKRGKQLVR